MLEENTQAILLLTAHFSRQRGGEPKPLTPTEYGRFAAWLHENKYQPRDLLQNAAQIYATWSDPRSTVTAERLRFLLGRGMACSIAIEKWQSAGLWIITRADPTYPGSLRAKLRNHAPAVMFGAGNKSLLNGGGLAVVGSRSVDEDDKAFATAVAVAAAKSGFNIVSGGARGVDETAMLAALEAEGTSLGVLSSDLLRTAISSRWRRYLKNGQLCLVSTYYPEAAFQVGNAMGRNKYIYCLSDAALVIRSEKGMGGTWAGAIENLKREFVPQFVRANSTATGNVALLEQGAFPFSEPPVDLAESQQWLLKILAAQAHAQRMVLSRTPDTQPSETAPAAETALTMSASDADSGPLAKHVFYNLFIERIQTHLATHGEINLKTLNAQNPDLSQKQIVEWLQRAVADGLIVGKGQVHNYALAIEQREVATQRKLFGDES